MATQEKDVDLSTDRDVQRASFTGSDDKSRVFGAATDMKVDIGEAEAVAAAVAGGQSVVQALMATLLQQQLRANEQTMRHMEELSVIKQRQLSNGAELDYSHSKSRNSQGVQHADIAADRQWNVDEQGYTVAKIVEGLGVDHRIALAAVLEALSGIIKNQQS
jgi:hypothetical protein